MSTTIETDVIDWINSTVPTDNDEKIVGSTPLVEKQLLDSLQIMDLVMFIEGKYSIQIPLDALTDTNFKTPSSVAAMVEKIQSEKK